MQVRVNDMVLVSHTNEFVFLKTRKTAGTSVEMCFEPACTGIGSPVVEETQTRISEYGIVGARLVPEKKPKWLYWKTNLWRSHVPAHKVKSALGAGVFDRYTKISCVRNPFDRCVSLFHWRGLTEKDFASTKRSFNDFLKNQRWPDDRKVTHVNDAYVIDHMIRFENLREDIEAVAKAVGVDIDPDALPHTKSTAQKRKEHAVADYYDEDTIEIVKSRLAWVFDRFPYSTRPGD